jgi:hypothetical protein
LPTANPFEHRAENKMVSAETALKVATFVCAFFFIGMTMFPSPFMDGYGVGFFDCPTKKIKGAPKCDSDFQKHFAMSVLSIFGINIMLFGGVIGGQARPHVGAKAKSVACLLTSLMWGVFSIGDGLRTLKSDWPEEIEKGPIYGNVVFFAILSALAYMGWKDSGSVMPNLSVDSVKALWSSKFGKPIVAGVGLLCFYGFPLILISDNFVEFFGRAEQMAGFTQPVNFMLSWLFFNIGLVCLFTAVLQLSLATVDAKDETIAYRVLRSSSLIWMYSNGAWSKDAVVNHLTGFEDPMRLFQFFTNFGLVMWSVNTWAKVPISLK